MSGPGLDLSPHDARYLGLRMVRPPAFLLLCVGLLNLLICALFVTAVLLHLPAPTPQSGDVPARFEFAGYMLWVVPAAALEGVLAVAGALSAMSLKRYGLVIAAAVFAMVPPSLTCPVGIPIGLWSLYMLTRPEVKRAFGYAPPPPRVVPPAP